MYTSSHYYQSRPIYQTLNRLNTSVYLQPPLSSPIPHSTPPCLPPTPSCMLSLSAQPSPSPPYRILVAAPIHLGVRRLGVRRAARWTEGAWRRIGRMRGRRRGEREETRVSAFLFLTTRSSVPLRCTLWMVRGVLCECSCFSYRCGRSRRLWGGYELVCQRLGSWYRGVEHV
jgi:hypothetical protein